MTNSWRCSRCRLIIRAESQIRCPKCGIVMAEHQPQPGVDVVRTDMTLVTGDVIAKHVEAATPTAVEYMLAYRSSQIKPYEDAIAHALALLYICKENRWKAQELVAMLQDVMP